MGRKSLLHSLVFFSNLQKFSEIVQKHLCGLQTVLENLRKSSDGRSEIFGKSSKMSLSVRLYNKQNNTWLVVDMEDLFLCLTLSYSYGAPTREILS